MHDSLALAISVSKFCGGLVLLLEVQQWRACLNGSLGSATF
jgi:hypothetical protein